jgi:3-mercaptopyruvate sulfurtransferase SseA
MKNKWAAALGVSFLTVLSLACVTLTAPFATATPAGEPTYPEIERVPLADAKAAFDAGTAVFVDVRTAASYNQSHVPGALSIPLNQIENRLDELDASQWIITYCT